MGDLMMIRKVFLYLILSILTLISMQVEKVDGAAFTMQREGAPLNTQEINDAAMMIKTDGHPSGLTPRMLKNKEGTDAVPVAGDPSERRVRYKPYFDGEGDRKQNRSDVQ